MVGEENENVVFTRRLEDSSSSFSFDFRSITLQNSHKMFRSHLTFCVIDFDTSIDIHSRISICRFIEDLSFEGIAGAAGNVIIGEGDDPIFREAPLSEDLICMKNVGLMSVV